MEFNVGGAERWIRILIARCRSVLALRTFSLARRRSAPALSVPLRCHASVNHPRSCAYARVLISEQLRL
jgi:hypothetical protein